MHFRLRRDLAPGAPATISKGAQLVLLFCSLGIASVLLVAGGTVASPYTNGTNSDEPSRGQNKAPPGMLCIPGGTFLMGTNESFPNERPAHFVQVQGFWIDEHDVTNAEFSKFVEATGYVPTAEGKVDWEDLKKELPPDRPKPDESYDPVDPYAPKRVVKGGSFLCNPSYCQSYRPSARRGTPPDTGSSHTGFRCVIAGENAQVTRLVGGEPPSTK
jgi:formylglycine-generating enzyme required for sulfatase activity